MGDMLCAEGFALVSASLQQSVNRPQSIMALAVLISLNLIFGLPFHFHNIKTGKERDPRYEVMLDLPIINMTELL